ncbi:hypothetical protein C9439_05290 [archaeon SCG-AAA382B04]|nr:hypothetical protein C9439_05290 [archaeon SCG-AAA382B04]
MKVKVEKEEKRQLVHLLLGVLLVILIEIGLIAQIGEILVPKFLEPISRVLLFVTLSGFVISFLCREFWVPLVSYFIRKLEREEAMEVLPGKGTLLASVGIFLTSIFFETNILSASILALAVGDSFSNLFGKYFGKTRIPYNQKKSLQGSIGGLVLSTISISIYFDLPIAIVGGFTAMLIESISLPLDDNLVIPITTALVITLVI